jgi:hypothetical protein
MMSPLKVRNVLLPAEEHSEERTADPDKPKRLGDWPVVVTVVAGSSLRWSVPIVAAVIPRQTAPIP